MRESLLSGTNPVLSRELRVALRNARSFALISIYVAILGAIVISDFPADRTIQIETSSGDKGRTLFQLFISTQALLVLLVLPALSAGAISQERERQTLEPLLLTPLTPMQVVWGKAAGVLALSSLLVLSTLPLTSLCFLLGGVSPAELVAAYALLLGLALFTASIGLYCSARWHKTIQATIACYLMLPILILIVGTLSFVGTPIMGVWAICLPLAQLHGLGKDWGKRGLPRKLGVAWWLLMWIVLIGLGAGAFCAILLIKDLSFIALGIFVVLYLLFVTQLGLQQAAREMARAQDINQPLRERVQDLHSEWQQALVAPSSAVADLHMIPRGPEYSGDTSSGFRIGAPVAVTAAVATGVATELAAPEPVVPPKREARDTYGVTPFLSDRLNPILAKDLRSGLLGKFEYLLRFSYVATIGTEVLLILLALTAGASSPADEARWFRSWALFHFFMLLIAAAWLGARAIAPEHEQQTLEQLISAPLTSGEIVRGKIMAVLAYTLYVWVMGLPMVILLLLVGSIKWTAALSFIIIELVFSLLVALWGIYCSIQRVTVRGALGYTLGGLFCLTAGSLFATSPVSRAVAMLVNEDMQPRVHLLVQALATMISPLSLMAHALIPERYSPTPVQGLALIPGALLLGCAGIVLLWSMTMRAFERYTQNL